MFEPIFFTVNFFSIGFFGVCIAVLWYEKWVESYPEGPGDVGSLVKQPLSTSEKTGFRAFLFIFNLEIFGFLIILTQEAGEAFVSAILAPTQPYERLTLIVAEVLIVTSVFLIWRGFKPDLRELSPFLFLNRDWAKDIHKLSIAITAFLVVAIDLTILTSYLLRALLIEFMAAMTGIF